MTDASGGSTLIAWLTTGLDGPGAEEVLGSATVRTRFRERDGARLPCGGDHLPFADPADTDRGPTPRGHLRAQSGRDVLGARWSADDAATGTHGHQGVPGTLRSARRRLAVGRACIRSRIPAHSHRGGAIRGVDRA